MAPWNYSGALPSGYFGPRGTEEVGREVGGTVWGDIAKGKFKYYLGILYERRGEAKTARQLYQTLLRGRNVENLHEQVAQRFGQLQ